MEVIDKIDNFLNYIPRKDNNELKLKLKLKLNLYSFSREGGDKQSCPYCIHESLSVFRAFSLCDSCGLFFQPISCTHNDVNSQLLDDPNRSFIRYPIEFKYKDRTYKGMPKLSDALHTEIKRYALKLNQLYIEKDWETVEDTETELFYLLVPVLNNFRDIRTRCSCGVRFALNDQYFFDYDNDYQFIIENENKHKYNPEIKQNAELVYNNILNSVNL